MNRRICFLNLSTSNKSNNCKFFSSCHFFNLNYFVNIIWCGGVSMWDGIKLDGHFNCCWLNQNCGNVYWFLNKLCEAFNNAMRCNWCSQHLFKHPCFVGIGIFVYKFWIVVYVDGFVWGETRWLVNLINIVHHEVSCMGWVEDWSWIKESCDHVIQASPEGPREVERSFICNVHGPIFFVMSSTCHVIVDFLGISKYGAPFILAHWPILEVNCGT